MKTIETGKQTLFSTSEEDYLESNIKVSVGGTDIEYNQFTFSGGEESVRICQGGIHTLECSEVVVHIDAKIKSSKDLIKLIVLTNAIKNIGSGSNKINLKLPYIPYARQDRVCEPGEAFSLKMFCDIINLQGYNNVTVTDPHSDVAPALINNVEIIPNYDVFCELDLTGAVIVSPDAGSLKKIYKFAQAFNCGKIVKADKIRDTKTGEITATEVYSDCLEGEEVYIVDDICDGGRTFIELAKVLKRKGVSKVTLIVTHGIFSKGLNVFDGLIDSIITTDSFYEGESNELITVIK